MMSYVLEAGGEYSRDTVAETHPVIKTQAVLQTSKRTGVKMYCHIGQPEHGTGTADKMFMWGECRTEREEPDYNRFRTGRTHRTSRALEIDYRTRLRKH
jgi:hypothetical protein